MQLIWVSGPAARVVTISITARKVLATVMVLSSLLVLVGFVFHFIGLRVAIEHVPELAYRMGGVTSQSEQLKAEAIYRAKLDVVQQQLETVADRLRQLERIKSEVLGRMGVDKLLPVSSTSRADPAGGRGGPMNLLPMWRLSNTSLGRQLDEALEQVLLYDKSLGDMHVRWQEDLGRLAQVPTSLPLAGEFLLTSSFGVRADPMTHLPSMHEGIDFVAPVGTPVLATAPGRVLRAEYSGAYGNLVEVSHADGFITRYAHLKTMFVKPGQWVEKLAQMGTLGNTGRSTGPHLHYEVIYKGRPMHPVKALAAWSQP